MIIFRIISLVVIAAALMLLGADVVTYLEGDGDVSLRSLHSVVNLFSSDIGVSLTEWKETLPGAVEPALGVIYNAPAWLSFGVIGILLAFLFRERG